MNYNNSKRIVFLPVILGITMVLGIIIGRYLPSNKDFSAHSPIRPRNDKLNSILNVIESNYVDSVNRNDLVESAIPAILKKLDPIRFTSRQKILPGQRTPAGNFEGIGISFSMLTDTILVISTIPGGLPRTWSPAGDKILYVNDSLVAGKHIADEKIMGKLKGPRGRLSK